ncbi:unnamed protein product, partial [Closterium sp. NIES-54]
VDGGDGDDPARSCRPLTGLDFLRGSPPTATLVRDPAEQPPVPTNEPTASTGPWPVVNQRRTLSDLLVDVSPTRKTERVATPTVSAVRSVGVSQFPKFRKFTQSTIRFARTRMPHIHFTQRRAPSPAAPATPLTPANGTSTSPSDPGPSTPSILVSGPDALLEELQKKCTDIWQRRFPWLLISQRKDVRPCMKCNVCIRYGLPHWQYSKAGDGGVDIQKQTMRKHGLSRKHQGALDRKARAEGGKVAQRRIDEYEDGVGEIERLKQLLLVVLFICKYGFREMTKAMVKHLKARQLRCIEESPFLGIRLDESTDRRGGEHLIMYLTFLKEEKVVTELFTHLTVEKGDASSLLTVLLAHLESTGVDMRKISGISTDGANVMVGSQNGPVVQLRMRVPHLVDITRVMGQVQNTCGKLKARYVEYGVNFAEDSEHLSAFLEAHTHPSKQLNKVEGMDGDGNAVTHHFKLHEQDEKGKEDPTGDVESCVTLATLFAKKVIGRLLYRMRSLNSLIGSKLFLPDAYPEGVAKRDRLCAEWFSSLRKMFNADKCALPGTRASARSQVVRPCLRGGRQIRVPAQRGEAQVRACGVVLRQHRPSVHRARAAAASAVSAAASAASAAAPIASAASAVPPAVAASARASPVRVSSVVPATASVRVTVIPTAAARATVVPTAAARATVVPTAAVRATVVPTAGATAVPTAAVGATVVPTAAVRTTVVPIAAVVPTTGVAAVPSVATPVARPVVGPIRPVATVAEPVAA